MILWKERKVKMVLEGGRERRRKRGMRKDRRERKEVEANWMELKMMVEEKESVE
jgi:hypothetical protein